MGNTFIILLFAILLVNCSPKVAEIQGEDISKNDLFRLLSQKDPRYFGKKISAIENKLLDWKRLRAPLEEYLNEEAVYLELSEKNFSNTINSKEMEFWHYGALAEYTYILISKQVSYDEVQAKKGLVYNEKLFSSDVEVDKLKGTAIKLLYPKEFVLSWAELKIFFPKDETKLTLIKWMQEVLIPQLYLSMEGYRQGFHKEPLFIQYWEMKKRKKLISLFESIKKKKLRNHIVANREDELKRLFEKEKEYFVHYKPNKENKDQLGPKYQYTYNRVREDLISRLIEKDLLVWKKKLKKKFAIKIEKSYFDHMSNEDSKKIEEQMKDQK